ncbi:hypothetical protein E6P09_07625 [Haloferax mediterranei ATCC 33500]|uniref:Uncharacterized protein n=1 Tax=Haloferax mediterranei (strain ATCC 33500 / DSM 1411 / JCM 8866 / NBRC 14739 / NCIMB 2177 / R-4) TaxID=523841 RepID=I3R327_HALMT|nr:hypothetical protein [Haloferax mediterranei]AFK18637.1 hypothetical protein HFX_0916 [Haloferax mediterranei ATCC 33500]AHZ21991.1 hypothetical protein BM92_04635 [Haloferax mediterranei ATCC 33500]EMA02087.1 hypothetical protein C439_05890 [Haloferax mediterranei ATCC 33500]MDX5988730.1 hypothetical protein [Haloferax mediterranei ATCC 33500]QCQ75137.1 hypothetical protein E6P09_07625 [Haloferax mediterranei ATCC 33500]
MNRRIASIALLVLVTVSTLATAGAFAQSAETNPPTLTMDQLMQGGEKPANAPDSVRASGSFGQYAVKSLPTGLLVIEGEDSPMWSFLEPGETVRRNYVRLESRRAFGVEPKNVTVRIAYWKVGTVTKELEDGTVVEESVAKNVTTHTQTVTVSAGYSKPVRIDLHPHYDEQVRTTMCVEEPGEPNCLANPGAKRWTFYHASTKAAKPIETNSEGSRLAWAIGLITLPFAGFTAVTLFAGRRLVEKARGSPSISLLAWVLVLIGTGTAMVLFWNQISSSLIRAPWMLGVIGGIFLGILATEWFGDNSYLALFVRLRAKDGMDSMVRQASPTDGGDRPDPLADDLATDGGESSRQSVDMDAVPGRLIADVYPQRMVRGMDGTRSAVKRGLAKFYARARGARADMMTNGRPQTSIEVTGGPYEELFFLDPESPNPVEYEAERHEIRFPDLIIRDEDGNANVNAKAIIGGLAALGASWLLGDVLLDSASIGLLIGGFVLFVTKVMRPVEGRFGVDLAPVHYGNALATLLRHADQIGNVKSWETLFDRFHAEKAENKAENKALSDRAEASQMDTVAKRYLGDDGQRASTDGGSDDE